MNKIKSIISYSKAIKSTRGKIIFLFHMLHALFKLPAFAFHELCHLLVAIPGGWDIRITHFDFFTIYPNTNTLKTFNMTINYQASKTVGMIGSLAPLIGWIIMSILLVLFHNWLIMYFILAFDTFFLSEQDIIMSRKNGFNRKISRFLYWIWNLFCKPRQIHIS